MVTAISSEPKIQLPPLPFEPNALEPYISRETLEYHYGKHHRAYVNKLNDAIAGTPLENLSLEGIIKAETGAIFNNAAQVWNHNFYWNCLSPQSSAPAVKLLAAIDRVFGSLEKFQEQFKSAALRNFGSGWTWLVRKPDGRLAIENTDDADTPVRGNNTPLLTCDVWEHAYYIDYRNDRGGYMDNFWKIVNWSFVSRNFGS
ncbi:MAG TPA: superoxide dismutase [Gammaproteobacteria bacterium]